MGHTRCSISSEPDVSRRSDGAAATKVCRACLHLLLTSGHLSCDDEQNASCMCKGCERESGGERGWDSRGMRNLHQRPTGERDAMSKTEPSSPCDVTAPEDRRVNAAFLIGSDHSLMSPAHYVDIPSKHSHGSMLRCMTERRTRSLTVGRDLGCAWIHNAFAAERALFSAPHDGADHPDLRPSQVTAGGLPSTPLGVFSSSQLG